MFCCYLKRFLRPRHPPPPLPPHPPPTTIILSLPPPPPPRAHLQRVITIAIRPLLSDVLPRLPSVPLRYFFFLTDPRRCGNIHSEPSGADQNLLTSWASVVKALNLDLRNNPATSTTITTTTTSPLRRWVV